MLDALWQVLGSGGKLLYVTCSVFQEENGEQVANFVERHPDATRLKGPFGGGGGQIPRTLLSGGPISRPTQPPQHRTDL